MIININGQQKQFSQEYNLQEIIAEICKDSRHVIAEVNGNIVKSNDWEEKNIHDGDTVELISFVGGG